MRVRSQLPEWIKTKTIYEVNLRQYTPQGTIKAFEEHLPRLKKLGVGIIWLMPVQPIGKLNRKGSMGSPYSISDYTAVAPEYGTLEDFKALVDKIHKAGMYVLLDWVANHTAWDHPWATQKPDYYYKDEQGNPRSPNDDWTDVLDLNFANKDLRKSMTQALTFWVKTCNIDGFRCDMAHLVPTDYWCEARQALDKIKKGIFMLAETENRELLDAFDMIYNWNIHHWSNQLAKHETTVDQFDQMFDWEINQFPTDSLQMFFTSNHDENAWHGSAVERLNYALESLNVLMFTLPGMPLIYGGQEAGLTQKLSLFEQQPIAWKDDKMTPFYQKLIKLKAEHPALWNCPQAAPCYRIHTSNNAAVLAFIRPKDDNQILVIINLSPNALQVRLLGDNYAGNYYNVFSQEKLFFEPDSILNLKAWQYIVAKR